MFGVQVACCCGSAACSLLCRACGSCNNSSVTRIVYALVLLVGTVVACIMLAPGLADELGKVWLLSSYDHFGSIGSNNFSNNNSNKAIHRHQTSSGCCPVVIQFEHYALFALPMHGQLWTNVTCSHLVVVLHNVLQCHQRKTEPLSWAKCSEKVP